MRKTSLTTRLLLALAVVALTALGAYRVFFPFWTYRGYEPAVGDVLFQQSRPNRLTTTIEGVTESKVSHCGIVVEEEGEWHVLEAIGPVKVTPLDEWIRHGIGNRFAAYRLPPALSNCIPDFVAQAYAFVGLPYDMRYELDDEKIYCSELVYKAYMRATGDELGALVKLGDLNWEPFEESIRHFEKGPVPLERRMITPRDLMDAPQLVRVYTNGF